MYNAKEKSQIWGVLYLSIAFWVMTALISNVINGTNNLLGPWLGTYLAFGLEYIFGPIPVFYCL